MQIIHVCHCTLLLLIAKLLRMHQFFYLNVKLHSYTIDAMSEQVNHGQTGFYGKNK